jgi:hypothetical protein
MTFTARGYLRRHARVDVLHQAAHRLLAPESFACASPDPHEFPIAHA